MKLHYKKLGSFISKVDKRNKDLSVDNLKGLSMTKEFRKSTSNIVGTDMSKYKIVEQWQFACDFMSVIRVHAFPVVLNFDLEPVLVSPAYPVFKVINSELLDPEYLMMWFRRTEFDRYADFKCDSAIRGGFGWEELCDVELPILPIEEQREIVREYNVVNGRISLNEELIQNLENAVQAIYKQWFVDFEFPIAKEYSNSIGKPELEGKPYKSSGGEMIYCEELEKDIPFDWPYGLFNKLIKIQNGYAFKSSEFTTSGLRKIIKIKNITPPSISLEESMFFDGELTPKLSKYEISSKDILISMTGSTANQMNSAVGQVGRYLLNYPSLMNQRVGKLTLLEDDISSEFCYQFISRVETHLELLAGSTGSANQANISPMQIESLKLVLPTAGAMSDYDCIAVPIVERLSLIRQENSKLEELKTIINIKMSKA
jgi:type I restriction enzyme S subunit